MQLTLPSLTTTMQVLPEPTEQTDIITTDLDATNDDDDDDTTTDLPIPITEDDDFIYATISDTTEDTTDAITIHLCRSTTETISAAFTLDDSSSVNRSPPATDSLITATARCCCRHEILSSVLGLPIHYFIFGGLTIVFIIIIVASSPSLYSYLLYNM